MINPRQFLNSLIAFTLAQCLCISTVHAAVDFIIFSYNRPMQLYALLESTEHYLTGIDSTTVIYRVSDERFMHGYGIVQKRFPRVQFIAQGSNPQADFKPTIMQAFNAGKSPYILFAPDDIIVKNYTDLQICTKAMEEHDAYGFFLRLGTHLDASYAFAQYQPIPPLTALEPNVWSWTFKDSKTKFDWGYPNNVDMTIYRKRDIQNSFETGSYTNPYTLESMWAHFQGSVLHKKGLCFTDSVIVNIPVNRVQQDYANNYMKSWSPIQLLEFFEAGQKIDITPLAGIKNKSCHIDYELTFKAR